MPTIRRQTGRIALALSVYGLVLLCLNSPSVAEAHVGTITGARIAADTGVPRTSQVIDAPYTLGPNASVSSDTARLIMQSDGNLVVYDEFNIPRWASNTLNRGYKAEFQTDGNFVVYTRSGHPVWASETSGHPGAKLAVQDDGNVVIYDGSQPIWATDTAH